MGRPAAAPAGQTGPPEALLHALARMLRPIVRLLISRSIALGTVTELLKRLYVEVADDEFRVEAKRQTDSRLHLLTGVHRKDVRRLRQERDAPLAAAPRKASLTSTLIACWTTMDQYRDRKGKLLALARTAAQGAPHGRGREKTPSFEDLVRSVSTDIRPRAVLDEWLRLGIVEIDEEERVHLRVEAFVPPKESEDILHYLGRNTGDHLATAVENVIGSREPRLERSTSWNQLTRESVDELRTLANEHGMDALRAVNKRASALQRRDSAARRRASATHRMSFGAWFFSEDEEPGGDSSASKEKPK